MAIFKILRLFSSLIHLGRHENMHERHENSNLVRRTGGDETLKSSEEISIIEESASSNEPVNTRIRDFMFLSLLRTDPRSFRLAGCPLEHVM
ncbi:Os11g0592550 [Oryza sativa Japonica Group]|uniref:Os11g0592550 protein n=1 Tax=Oryza sativa subsp. japonica TaxID=39947 RepID=A0A0P0Y3T8_ORYSJ|nr:hypothetical protein EE612_056440 [Oryza sativa]BAT14689.1 Os11g0592550 [Oryza sativa Japonica Group]